MTEFTASNGVRVESEDDRLIIPAESFVLGPKSQQALREFFLHERDEQLGRWRWPENPDYLVYADLKLIIHEGTRMQWDLLDRWEFGLITHPIGVDPDWILATRAYFDAHPEPKSWYDANPGEVWELEHEFAHGKHPIYVRTEKGWRPVARRKTIRFDREFISGRRIWPEVSE